MLVLALDTASVFCAAAITASGRLLAGRSENIGKGHAEYLMDYIATVMQEADKDFAAIDRIAVNIGPGSFTGVRVGVAAARGLALALGKPAVGVNAFEALAFEAEQARHGRPVTVVLEAHRGALYSQSFAENGQATGKPQVLTAAEIAAALPQGAILTGSGAQEVAQHAPRPVAGTMPTAAIETYAILAARKEAGPPPSPLYMRAPDAKPQTGFALRRA